MNRQTESLTKRPADTTSSRPVRSELKALEATKKQTHQSTDKPNNLIYRDYKLAKLSVATAKEENEHNPTIMKPFSQRVTIIFNEANFPT